MLDYISHYDDNWVGTAQVIAMNVVGEGLPASTPIIALYDITMSFCRLLNHINFF